jgi:hypothetical protein
LAALDRYLRAATAASRGVAIDDFRLLFSDSCALCLTQYRNFDTAYAQGKSAEGELYSSWDLHLEDLSGDQALIRSVADAGEIVINGPDGTTLEVFPAEIDITTVWTLERQGSGAWLVVDATDLP